MPENTLPAFLKAVELGVTTLEMDVVISKDAAIVVSHEPWMSYVICSHPDGKPVLKKEAKKLNLYHMDYALISQFDCGMRLHPKFPDQQKLPAVKPTLKMIVRAVDKFSKDKRIQAPFFNIEIKSDPSGYDLYHPQPKQFTRMVVDEIRRLDIEAKTILQSFDRNVLEELYKIENRKFRISYLVEHGKNINKNLDRISFIPDIYSPKYKLLSAETIQQCHAKNIQVIPWTVNDVEEMMELKAWGCDGGITDYPDKML